MCVTDGFVLAGDTARDADFDEVGAGFELFTDDSAKAVGSVSFDGSATAVAVATRGDASHASGEDSWAHGFATGDG